MNRSSLKLFFRVQCGSCDGQGIEVAFERGDCRDCRLEKHGFVPEPVFLCAAILRPVCLQFGLVGGFSRLRSIEALENVKDDPESLSHCVGMHLGCSLDAEARETTAGTRPSGGLQD